jgi:GNAT superfamily N-acetyltransferase
MVTGAGSPSRRSQPASPTTAGVRVPDPQNDVLVRRATDADTAEVLILLGDTMGWRADEPNEPFFAWKHLESPFGPSPAWVAVDAGSGRIVGFRTFMRWEFDVGDTTLRAVRAVDTATHPDAQGRGVFSRLTLGALDELRAEGTSFVFNTPNERSRPGYLKMGWREVGRVPIEARPRTLAALARLVKARVPAEKWSQPSDAGEPAGSVFADHGATSALLTATAPASGLSTRRTPEFLAWRYGFGPLHYRVLRAGAALADGLVVFRLRRRGPATEAAVTDLLVPARDHAAAARLCRSVLRTTGADYLVRLPMAGVRGCFPVPGQGPTLVQRVLDDAAPGATPADWRLTLGDVELF